MKALKPILIGALTVSAFLFCMNASAQKNVVLLGNSIVKNGSWMMDNLTVKSTSVVDYTSKQLSWTLDWGVFPHKPLSCIVVGGQEDFFLNIPPNIVAQNFIHLAEKLSEKGVSPVLTSVILLYDNKKINKQIIAHNDILQKMCNKKGIDYIDLNEIISGKGGLYQAYAGDGTYLSEMGYGVLNEVFNSYMTIGEIPMMEPNTENEKIELQPVFTSELTKERVNRIMKDTPANVKIAMLGNSITQGGGNWNAKLGRSDVRNCGQGGYTTGQMLWMMDTVVISAKPEMCFVMGGVNDISVGVPVEVIVANVGEIVKKLLKNGIKPVIQSTLYQSGSDSQAKISTLNEQLKAICEKEGLDYLDINEVLSTDMVLNPEVTTDGTHLNDKGYELWSGVLKEYLK